MKNYGFGVDIGGTTVKIGFFHIDGTMLEKWEIPTNTENHGAAILEDVAASVLEKIAEKGIAKEEILGIGLGVPGPVDSTGVVHKCVNLGWGVFNVEEALSEKTGLMVKAGNDANVAALGEAWQGGGKGYQNVVMVTLGTGVGGGIILNGKILPGTNGAAGEIGHIHVNDEEEECCGCGNKGCLEQYASATGIVRMAKKKLASETRQTVLTGKEPLTAKDIFDAAKEGDVVAAELVEKLCDVLGTTLARISCVIDPEVFVIGGGVSKAGEILTEGAARYYDINAFHASRNCKITLAKLGNDAGMYGSMKQLF